LFRLKASIASDVSRFETILVFRFTCVDAEVFGRSPELGDFLFIGGHSSGSVWLIHKAISLILLAARVLIALLVGRSNLGAGAQCRSLPARNDYRDRSDQIGGLGGM
jgi:hypothetical protein